MCLEKQEPGRYYWAREGDGKDEEISIQDIITSRRHVDFFSLQ